MSQKPYKRHERVKHLIAEEVSNIIEYKISDPRIGLITVVSVDLSPDLSSAKIYFSFYGSEEEKKRSKKGLVSAKSFIRSELAKRLKMRYVPEIALKFDETIEYSFHISEILEELKEEETEIS